MHNAYIPFFHTMSHKHVKEVTLISCGMIAKMQCSDCWDRKKREKERKNEHESSKTTQQVLWSFYK